MTDELSGARQEELGQDLAVKCSCGESVDVNERFCSVGRSVLSIVDGTNSVAVICPNTIFHSAKPSRAVGPVVYPPGESELQIPQGHPLLVAISQILEEARSIPGVAQHSILTGRGIVPLTVKTGAGFDI